ncbi:hypothetical protein, partial [Microcystis aeruginosa]|uniref:hypothetical protein n=1 Tax=Microcystis aeruginosa TaxID=1126 RepID=UPI001C0EC402
NPDLRRPHQCPSPEIPQVIEELKKYLEPRLFTPLKYMRRNHEKIMVLPNLRCRKFPKLPLCPAML